MRKALINVFFVSLAAAVILILSKVDWMFGFVPFCLLVLFVAYCVVQYGINLIVLIIMLASTAITGLRGDWRPFEKQSSLALATSFRLAEGLFELFVVWRLLIHFIPDT